MAYSIKDDILKALSLDNIIGLTDDDGLGVVDDNVVSQMIADADAVIDTYLEGHYDLPLNPVPAMIKRLSVALAIYNLYARRPQMEIPESVKTSRQDGIRFLAQVSAKKVSLGAGQPATTTSGGVVLVTGNDRLFSRDKLRGGF